MDASHPILNSHILYYIGHGDILPKGDGDYLREDTVVFRDGSFEEIDIIIYATGYNREFPFLDPGLLNFKNKIPDLFLHLVPKNIDNMVFLGFINSATGFGSAIKSAAIFFIEYLEAFYSKNAGFREFNIRKKTDNPNVGQNHYESSYRHQWEVDLWMYLNEISKYREILSKK